MLKAFRGPDCLDSEDGVVWQWHPLVNFYIWLTICSCCGSLPLGLELMVRAGGLRTLCHSCRLAFQQSVLKPLPSAGYLLFEDGVVWLWHPLVNLYISLTISSSYDSIPLALGLIVRDSVLNPLCHGSGLAFHQRVLKRFPGSGSLHSEDRVVSLLHPLANLHVWLTILSCYGSIPLVLALIVMVDGLSNLCNSCGFAFSRGCKRLFLALAISTPGMG